MASMKITLDYLHNSFEKNKRNLALGFFILFLIFGMVISISGYFFSQYILEDKNTQELDRYYSYEINKKRDAISAYLEKQDSLLSGIVKNSTFKKFMEGDESQKEDLTSLFHSITSSNSHIMKIRFLDNKGFETIKVCRKNKEITINNNLQDKSKRYYFKEISQLTNPDKTWYSKLDLNKEWGKIEVPLNPTIRVARAIFDRGEFKGFVIANLYGDKLLKILKSSMHFDTAIVDIDREIISHFSRTDRDWSRFFQERKNFEHYYSIKNNVITDLEDKSQTKLRVFDITNAIPNNYLKIYYTPNQQVLLETVSLQQKYVKYIIAFAIILTIPLAVILSSFPFKYTKRLIRHKEEQLRVIDSYVLTSTSDLKGNITDISTALLEVTGFRREELIGKNHNIFKHPDTSVELYKDMWSTILNGRTWIGELKDLKKDGTVFWVEVSISPIFDENKNIQGFTAVRHDITYRKVIEELSITDELTTLFNKRHFNTIFPNEIKRADRAGFPIIFAILDIDNFKQFNDTYGHQEGDKTLQQVGLVLHKNMKRANDFAFRLGGEEFGLLFSEEDPKKVHQFLNKLRKEILALNIPHKTNVVDLVSVTIGYKFARPEEGLTQEQLYKLADNALYEGKRNGRNQVERSNN